MKKWLWKCLKKIKDQLDNSRYIIFGKSLRRAISKIYYNAGYRKIDENCAVITKAELKEYKRQAVKEFAEKLKEKCSDYLYDTNFDGKNDFDIYIGELSRMIDELLKEYE